MQTKASLAANQSEPPGTQKAGMQAPPDGTPISSLTAMLLPWTSGSKSGMDQGSDFISDFRARRIRTQINSPGQASVGHARGCFSVSPTRLQWSTHQVSVQHAPGFSCVGVLEPLAPSDFLRKSREILEPVAKSWESPAGKFWEFCIRRHRSRSRVHQSQPEKRRDLCSHVTQPRARVKVSCSRAGHRRGGRGAGEPQEEGCEGLRRLRRVGARPANKLIFFMLL